MEGSWLGILRHNMGDGLELDADYESLSGVEGGNV